MNASQPGADPTPEPAAALDAPASRAYVRVLDWVEGELRAGRLRIGDQLPGERALAEEHGISRASVRDAIRTLEVMGLVRTATGSGPRAGAVLISRPAKGISNMLRLHVASSGLMVEDIVEVRALLETWAATVVDLNVWADGGREVLEEAADLLEMMDDITLSRDEFQALDTRFHVLLAKLAGNAVLDAIMASLKDAVGDVVSAAVPTEGEWAPIAHVLRGQHREIFGAVSGGQPERAAHLLREHIEWFYAHTTERRPGQPEHPPRLG